MYFVHFKMSIKLELMRSEKIITNWYEVQRNLFTSVIREHILANFSSGGLVVEYIDDVFCQCVSPREEKIIEAYIFEVY
jgi:hypothetical protein